MREYIGVDIGGTKIAVVKGDETGRVTKKIRFENNLPMKESVARILAAVRKMGEAEAVGISCGGPLDAKRGLILSPPNLPGWDGVPIVSLIEEATGLPAFLQNDADACALAEWKFGAGRGADHMIFLTFGTGMGAGLILNGQLYSGACGNAGEIGHIRMRSFGPVGYGKAGSFEGFASGGGIAQLAKSAALERLQQGQTTAYCAGTEEMAGITAETVAKAAEQGDPTALEVWRLCGEILGCGISYLIDLLNPQRIVIGSIYTRSSELLIPAMKQSIQREALSASASVCEILPAALGESLGDTAALSVAVNGLTRRN